MNKLNTLISLSSVLLTGYVIKRANREIKKAVMTSEAGLEIINRQRKMIDRYSDVVDFTATLKEANDVEIFNVYRLTLSSDKSFNGELVYKENDMGFGRYGSDYYEHVTDDTMTVRQFEQLNPDIVSVNRFINLAEQQRLKGLEKYRTSLEDAGLSVEELITHAEEEIVDNWYYIQALKQSVKDYGEQMYAKGLTDGQNMAEAKVNTLGGKDEWRLY